MRYFHAIIPLFVAIDVIGILPFFVSLTEDMRQKERQRIIHQSVITAFVTSLGFLAVGKFIFQILGIKVFDFKIAGGIILLIIAINDLLFPSKIRRNPSSTVGIVPIGLLLIVGPAVLTTIILSVDTYGYLPTISALIINLIIVWIAFLSSGKIIGVIGDGGAKAFGKIISIFLAAIGIMMIRSGIFDIIRLSSELIKRHN